MGLLDKLLGGKKNFSSILTDTQNELFALYNQNNPTDAQKMKASVYLCISGIAILNDIGGGAVHSVIDRLVEETKELTKNLSMRVGDLSNNREQLEKILQGFPKGLDISESTTVNGLAGFEALYFSIGEELMKDILNHSSGPMGTPGYAAIVVTDGVFGEGKSAEKFMEVSMLVLNFTNELVEAI